MLPEILPATSSQLLLPPAVAQALNWDEKKLKNLARETTETKPERDAEGGKTRQIVYESEAGNWKKKGKKKEVHAAVLYSISSSFCSPSFSLPLPISPPPVKVLLLLRVCFCPPSVFLHFKQSTTLHLICFGSATSGTHVCRQKQQSQAGTMNHSLSFLRRKEGGGVKRRRDAPNEDSEMRQCWKE